MSRTAAADQAGPLDGRPDQHPDRLGQRLLYNEIHSLVEDPRQGGPRVAQVGPDRLAREHERGGHFRRPGDADAQGAGLVVAATEPAVDERRPERWPADDAPAPNPDDLRRIFEQRMQNRGGSGGGGAPGGFTPGGSGGSGRTLAEGIPAGGVVGRQWPLAGKLWWVWRLRWWRRKPRRPLTQRPAGPGWPWHDGIELAKPCRRVRFEQGGDRGLGNARTPPSTGGCAKPQPNVIAPPGPGGCPGGGIQGGCVVFLAPLPAGGLAVENCLKEHLSKRGRRAACPLTNPRDCKASGESSTPVPQSGCPLRTAVPHGSASGGKGGDPLDPGCRGTLGLTLATSCRQETLFARIRNGAPSTIPRTAAETRIPSFRTRSTTPSTARLVVILQPPPKGKGQQLLDKTPANSPSSLPQDRRQLRRPVERLPRRQRPRAVDVEPPVFLPPPANGVMALAGRIPARPSPCDTTHTPGPPGAAPAASADGRSGFDFCVSSSPGTTGGGSSGLSPSRFARIHSPLHGRGPVGVRRQRQDAGLREQPPPPLGERHAAELVPIDAINPAKPGQPLIHKGVVGSDQIGQRPVLRVKDRAEGTSRSRSPCPRMEPSRTRGTAGRPARPPP